MAWRPDQPYNQLPPLPPAKEVTETLGILKACIPARAALAASISSACPSRLERSGWLDQPRPASWL